MPDGWPAGLKATAAMRKLIEGRTVACEFRGHDRYKRSIGLCRADGRDLGAAMASAGMAWRQLHDQLPQLLWRNRPALADRRAAPGARTTPGHSLPGAVAIAIWPADTPPDTGGTCAAACDA